MERQHMKNHSTVIFCSFNFALHLFSILKIISHAIRSLGTTGTGKICTD